MNERIKELAKQADIKLDYFGYGVDIDGGNPNVSKFAELIVRECIGIVKEYSEDGPHCQCQMIKQHFGVEE